MASETARERLVEALSGREDPESTPRTQSALARRLGVSTAAVSAWVHGKARPGLDHAVRLEQLYGIPVAEWASKVGSVLLVLLALGCSSESPDATEPGHFGATCEVASECESLRYALDPKIRGLVECDAATGPKLCRFACVGDLAEEACITLGGTCLNQVCLP